MFCKQLNGKSQLILILCIVLFTFSGSMLFAFSDGTYFPDLNAPDHIYSVSTYDSGYSDMVDGFGGGGDIGDVSAATTFEFDIYKVSAGTSSGSVLHFGFYEHPFYNGMGIYEFNLADANDDQWDHYSIPVSSIPTYDGMDWSKGGILQIKCLNADFNIWIDNAAFYNGSTKIRELVDGETDTWGHTFTTEPEQGIPPVTLDGDATHFIAQTNEWANNLTPSPRSTKLYVMLGSLQGLLLKQGHSEGIHLELTSDYRNNIEDIATRRNITYEYVAWPKTPWWLIQHFKPQFGSRYVLYDQATNPDSVNAAYMASYLYDAVMIDEELKAEAIANGLTLALDVSTYDDQWIWDNWADPCASTPWHRKDIAIDQPSEPKYGHSVAVGPICFHDATETPLRHAFLDALEDDSPVIGWMEAGYSEVHSSIDNSEHSTWWIATQAYNTALYSALREPSSLPLQQNTHSDPDTSQTNKHYVTFLMTDGDNPGWYNNTFAWDSNWWASPFRGQVPIGWGLLPAMRDIGQAKVEYLYDTASTDPNARDYFIAQSPIGYGYPSYFTPEARSRNAEQTAKHMGDLDLSILMILDISGFDNPETNYGPYLAQPEIDAMFYWDTWNNYAKYQGEIKWVNNKPIISGYSLLWGDTAYTPENVADAVNLRSTDPTDPNSYSLIGIHVWSQSVADAVYCASLFDSDVEVVTPEEFVKLIKHHIVPPPTPPAYDIDLGDQQLGVYASSDPSFVFTTNSTEQQMNGTPSTKMEMGSSTAHYVNMDFSVIDIVDANLLDVDIYGDGSGAIIRLSLHSKEYLAQNAFLYKYVTLDFTGWRRFSWNLDGSNDGLLFTGGVSREDTLSSIDILQVNGPSNSITTTFYLDNVKILTSSPYDLNNDGSINLIDLSEVSSRWLSSGPDADFNYDRTVDTIDLGFFTEYWLTDVP